jgi:hypothetical protein
MSKFFTALATVIAIGVLSAPAFAADPSSPNYGNSENTPNTDSSTAHNSNVNSTKDNGGGNFGTDPSINGND